MGMRLPTPKARGVVLSPGAACLRLYSFKSTKRMIRRAILKALAIPGYQVPFASREMPMPYGWGTGGVQVTAACLTPAKGFADLKNIV